MLYKLQLKEVVFSRFIEKVVLLLNNQERYKRSRLLGRLQYSETATHNNHKPKYKNKFNWSKR